MKKVKVKRIWGWFCQYTNNEKSTVKILCVRPNKSLSLQSHKNRDEMWVVLDNGLKVEVGKETFIPSRDDVFIIPKNTKHRLSSIGGMARILEISFGEFDEEDIKRYDE